jgi:hypothetical protein
MTAQPGAQPSNATRAKSSSTPESGQRRVIDTFTSYSDAERAVDYLSDQKFPVGRVAIIGRDLEMVEQVIGRLNYGGAALRGAGTGAITGVLFGWIFGLFNWINPLVASLTLAVYGLVFGAIIGALLGLIFHAMQRGRRDFASVRAMLPTRYDLVVDEEVADEAVRMLATMSRGGA